MNRCGITAISSNETSASAVPSVDPLSQIQRKGECPLRCNLPASPIKANNESRATSRRFHESIPRPITLPARSVIGDSLRIRELFRQYFGPVMQQCGPWFRLAYTVQQKLVVLIDGSEVRTLFV